MKNKNDSQLEFSFPARKLTKLEIIKKIVLENIFFINSKKHNNDINQAIHDSDEGFADDKIKKMLVLEDSEFSDIHNSAMEKIRNFFSK